MWRVLCVCTVILFTALLNSNAAFNINLVRNKLYDDIADKYEAGVKGSTLEQPSLKIMGEKYEHLVTTNASLLAMNDVLDKIQKQWEKQGFRPLTKIEFDETAHGLIIQEYCDALRNRNFGFIGSICAKYSNLAESMARTFNTPYITWDSNFNENQSVNTTVLDRWRSVYDKGRPKCRVFSMRPDLIQPLVEYLINWKWKRVAYLYASDEAFHRMESVKFALSQNRAKQAYSIHSIVADRGRNLHSKSEADMELEIESGFINLDNPNNVHTTLEAIDQYLQHSEKRQIVIDLGGDNIGSKHNNFNRLIRLFSWLTHMGMMRKEYNYLLLDFHIMDLPLSPFKNSGVNISGFHLINYESQNIKPFIQQWADVDLDKHSIAFIEETFEVISHVNTNLAQARKRNFIDDTSPTCYDNDGTYKNQSSITKWDTGDWISEFLVTTDIPGKITGTIRFDPLTCKRTAHDLILAEFSGERGAQITASWSFETSWAKTSSHDDDENGMHSAEMENEDHKDGKSLIQRYQEENKVIRVVTVKEEPFVMYKPKVDKKNTQGKENFQGYCIDLADKIFSFLNVSYDVHLVKDGKYGEYNKVTRTWNGMVGELERGEADVAIAPLTMSSVRANNVIFTEPFMNLGLSVIMRKPGKTKPGTFSFLSPLKSEVWLLIILASFIVSIALKLISLISPYEKARPDNTGGFSVSNSMWFSLASFVHQGIDLFPISPGARILAAVWRIFCLLMMAYYTANLAAALSFERLISPINSLRDLVEKDNHGISVGSLDSGSTKNFFATSNDSIYRAVHEKMSENPSWYSKTTEIALRRVRKGSYAFILESKMNEYVNQRKPCNTMMVGDVFGSKDYAVAVLRGPDDAQSLRDHITDVILRLREEQTLAKLYTEWWLEKGECTDGGEGSKSEPLALVNLSGAFYILVTGLVLAMMVGMLLLLHRLKREKTTPINMRNQAVDESHPGSLIQSVHITEF